MHILWIFFNLWTRIVIFNRFRYVYAIQGSCPTHNHSYCPKMLKCWFRKKRMGWKRITKHLGVNCWVANHFWIWIRNPLCNCASPTTSLCSASLIFLLDTHVYIHIHRLAKTCSCFAHAVFTCLGPIYTCGKPLVIGKLAIGHWSL